MRLWEVWISRRTINFQPSINCRLCYHCSDLLHLKTFVFGTSLAPVLSWGFRRFGSPSRPRFRWDHHVRRCQDSFATQNACGSGGGESPRSQAAIRRPANRVCKKESARKQAEIVDRKRAIPSNFDNELNFRDIEVQHTIEKLKFYARRRLFTLLFTQTRKYSGSEFLPET